jgi:hypothetical protein
VLLFRWWGNLRCEFKFVSLAANPLGLRGTGRKKGKGLEPFFTSLEELILFLKSFGARRNANEFLTVDKRVALIAGERAER